MADGGALRLGGEPFPFGVTFLPPEVLTGAEAPSAGVFADSCASLGASFAFIPRSLDQGECADELRAHGVAPFHVVDGALWPLIKAQGFIEGLRRTLTDPDGFGAEIEQGVQGLHDSLAEAGRLGARALVLAEDLAGSQGPLAAPDFVISELMPRYAPFVRSAREIGIPAVFHSDGDIRTLLPAIARAGFVAVHAGGGLTVEGFLRLFRAARAEGLAVIGGLLTGELLTATRAEALGGALGRLARGGGLMVADDGGITTPAQLERLTIALGVARAV